MFSSFWCETIAHKVFESEGYLSLNPLMYIWDQYVISADVPGYHEELLPIYASIILMVIRDQLLVTRSVSCLYLFAE